MEEFTDEAVVKISGWALNRKTLRAGTLNIVLTGQDKQQYIVNQSDCTDQMSGMRLVSEG